MLAQQLSPDLQREIDELAEDGFNQWRDFATPVQKAIGSAENDRWVNDPDFAA